MVACGSIAPLAARPCLLQKPWRPSVWKQLYRFSYAHEQRTPKSFKILHLSPVKYNFSCKSPSSTQFQAGWVCDWGVDKRSMQTFTIRGFQETSVTRRPMPKFHSPTPKHPSSKIQLAWAKVQQKSWMNYARLDSTASITSNYSFNRLTGLTMRMSCQNWLGSAALPQTQFFRRPKGLRRASVTIRWNLV